MQEKKWQKLAGLSNDQLNALTEEQLKEIIIEEYKGFEAENKLKFGTSKEKSETLWRFALSFKSCDKSILEALLKDFLKKPEGRELFEKLFSLDPEELMPRISECKTYETIARDNKEAIDAIQKHQDQLYKFYYFVCHYKDTMKYIFLLNNKIKANKPKNVTNTALQESKQQDAEIQISDQKDTTVRVVNKQNNSLNSAIGRTQKVRLKTFEELSKAIANKLEAFGDDKLADFEERFQEINRALESNGEITRKILDEAILKLEELNQEISSAQGVITDDKYYSEDEILDSFEQRIREKFSNFAPQDVHMLQEPKAWIVLQTIADFYHTQKINIDMLLDEVKDDKERDVIESMIFGLKPEELYERKDLSFNDIIKKHEQQIKLVQKHNDLFNKIYFFLKDPEVLQIIGKAKAYAESARENLSEVDELLSSPRVTTETPDNVFSSVPASSKEAKKLVNLAEISTLAELREQLGIPEDAKLITFHTKAKSNIAISIENKENVFQDMKSEILKQGCASVSFIDKNKERHDITGFEFVTIVEPEPEIKQEQLGERMKTAAEIFVEARSSSRENGTSHAILQNGSYNTGFTLDGRQIHAQALIRLSQKMGISLNEAAKYYIDEISVEEGGEDYLAEETVNEATGKRETKFQAFYGDQVQKAVEEAKKGKPAFLAIIDGSHSVLLSLIQDKKDANKVHVIYTNSIPADQTGVRFVEHVKNKLNEDGVLSGDDATFASTDQQYDDCCGLSVADNIASIAKHCSENGEADADSIKRSLFTPQNSAAKEGFYKEKGRELFEALDRENIDFDQVYTPIQIPASQRPASAQNANRNGNGASANQEQVPEAQASTDWGKPKPKKQTQNDSEGENKKTDDPEAKKDKKKEDENKSVNPKNHDKEKDSISWEALGWLTGIYLAIGAFAAPLVPAVVAAVVINVMAAATKFFVGVLDALKGLIEAITSLIKGILDSVRALLQLFGKGVDYVVTKVTGKEKIIDDVPVQDVPRREQNQPEHQNPKNPEQPDGPANERANQRPINLAGLTVPAAETQTQAANTASVPPAQPVNRAPIIKDLPTQSETNAANAKNAGANLSAPAAVAKPAATTAPAAQPQASGQSSNKPVLSIGTIIPGRPTGIFNDGSTIIAGDASSAATTSQNESLETKNTPNPADKTHASRARSNSNPSEKPNTSDSKNKTIQRRNSDPILPTRK